MTALANKYRPAIFADVVGQETETNVIKAILRKGWKPNAIMLNGPFGTGKTTLARLIARAMLCDDRQYGPDQPQDGTERPYEPCGKCSSCQAMDTDNNPNYVEVDAASNGLIQDVRSMKDLISYRTGNKPIIITYDESHGLSAPAQNALLPTLEEANSNVLFLFATTDPQRMLPTIRSRCTVLSLKLLSTDDIKHRVLVVAAAEGTKITDRSAAIIATYVRGHVRDALVMLEQLSQMADADGITEEMVRQSLRLDKYDEIYQLLVETDRKTIVEKLEYHLCNYAASNLAELVGEVLVNSYKLNLGINTFTATDAAWLKRVYEARGASVLQQAEDLLSLHMDFASINYGIAAFARVLAEDTPNRPGPLRNSLTPGSASQSPAMAPMRKPGKPAV